VCRAGGRRGGAGELPGPAGHGLARAAGRRSGDRGTSVTASFTIVMIPAHYRDYGVIFPEELDRTWFACHDFPAA
jgi:hypothetical protein